MRSPYPSVRRARRVSIRRCVRVEVLDVETVEAERRPRVGDGAQVREVVAVARVCDHDPRRIDPCCGQRLECGHPGGGRSVRMHHHGRAGFDRGRGYRGQDLRHVADESVPLDRALEKRGSDAGVVDSHADLAHEQLGECLDAPVGEEIGELDEGVHAARHDDVEVDRGVDPLEARDEAAEARRGRIDDRLDACRADGAQLLDGVGDADVLVPVALPPDVPVVLQRLRLHDEHVLVHERAAEPLDVNRPAYGLDRPHQPASLWGQWHGRLLSRARATGRRSPSGSAAARRP